MKTVFFALLRQSVTITSRFGHRIVRSSLNAARSKNFQHIVGYASSFLSSDRSNLTPRCAPKREVIVTLCLTIWSSAMGGLEPKILYEQDPSLLISTVEVVVLTGSADDPLGKNGATNLLGELLLRGTKKKTRTQFQSEIERLGANLDIHVSHDHISVVGKVIKENTAPFLKLLYECITQPGFKESEFNSLKTEKLNEIQNSKNSNGRLSGLALRRELFRGTVLERPGVGSLSTLKSLKLVNAVQVYNNHFNRGNVLFAAVSALPIEEIKPTLHEIWLKLPDGAHRQRRSTALELPNKPTLILVHKPNTTTGSVMMGQGGITAQDPLRYRLQAGNFAFGNEPLISRLFKIVRAELGWTYFIGSSYQATGNLSYQRGFFTVTSTPAIEHTVKTIFKTLSLWREYLDNSLTKDELNLAKESLVNSYPFEFESAEKRLYQKLYSHLYGVPILDPAQYAQTISDISNVQIKDALKERHDANGWVISIVADKGAIEKQLEEEQKGIPPEKKLVISKVYSPEQLIE